LIRGRNWFGGIRNFPSAMFASNTSIGLRPFILGATERIDAQRSGIGLNHGYLQSREIIGSIDRTFRFLSFLKLAEFIFVHIFLPSEKGNLQIYETTKCFYQNVLNPTIM
jgi:hypothetical protein